MSYVVGSKVKELIKKAGCNTAGDFVTALSEVVECKTSKACKRAKANGRKTVRGTDVVLGMKAKDVYVVGSKVKELNKKNGCNTSGDFMEAMSVMVEWSIQQACERAQANGRKTVRATDL